MGVLVTDPLSQLNLPPGFRFYPTDEELLVQYLCRKVAGHDFPLQIIGDIDLYKFDPWNLPGKAIFGEKEWYFFSPRDRKYPNGSRPNRVAGSGYWKATGTDKVITTEGRKVGIKKALVFYVGKAPKGTKTNWIMHEYRLSDPQRKHGSARLDDWVLCRIYKKNSSVQKAVLGDSGGGVIEQSSTTTQSHGSSSSSSSRFDDVLESLPEIEDRSFTLPRMNSLNDKLNFPNLSSGHFDWATLAGFNSMPPDQVVTGNHTAPMVPPNQALYNNNQNNYMCVSSLAPLGHMDNGHVKNMEQEVESCGLIKPQRVANSSGFFDNANNSYCSGFTGSVDPFAIRYPVQPENVGFRH